MDKIIITGPAKLTGVVEISSAKNAYLPILIASLLTKDSVRFKNIPQLRDIRTTLKILEKMGARITESGEVTTISSTHISSLEVTYDLVKTMRASILVLGPLLARFKKAKVSLPGGCAIGTRPIDIHLKNLEKLGAQITLEGGYVEATTKSLKGARLVLSFPSVGATESLMMAASLAEGETVIENAAQEPEIIDLAKFLNILGVEISGAGTSIVKIQGRKECHCPEQITFQAIGDRVEAGTYIIAALITNSKLRVQGFNPQHLENPLQLLKDHGAKFLVGDNYVEVHPSVLKPLAIDTAPYPGFPTDLQAQLIALCTRINGISTVTENIFENRFMHVAELTRLGAKIELKGNTAVITGGGKLTSAPLMCTDLRASAALIIAGLAAEGETEIRRVYHLDRGYENLYQKLKNIGVQIERFNPGKYDE